MHIFSTGFLKVLQQQRQERTVCALGLNLSRSIWLRLLCCPPCQRPGAMPNGNRVPYRIGSTPSPGHTSDSKETHYNKRHWIYVVRKVLWRFQRNVQCQKRLRALLTAWWHNLVVNHSVFRHHVVAQTVMHYLI